MANLYLVWFGLGSTGPDQAVYSLYGISCSGPLPHFNYPQVPFGGNLQSVVYSRPALAALSDRILLAFNSTWGGDALLSHTLDSGIGSAYCQSWPKWPGLIEDITGVATSWSPALVPWGAGALMVWPGLGSDTRIWCSQYYAAQNTWSNQFLTQLPTGKPIQSESTPAIVNFNGKLLMVWLGEGSNDGLYYATSADGLHWQGNQSIPGAASTIAPSLVMFKGNPVLAFKGMPNDSGIYSTTYHAATNSWAPVTRTGPFGTSHGPSLAVYGGELFMTWKGVSGDTDLYWATTPDNLNPLAWSGQSVISNAGSPSGPTAIVF